MFKNKNARKLRHFRIRKKIFGTAQKPRLVVFVSNKHFYAQIINDEKQTTLLAYSSLNLEDITGNNKTVAAEVGKELGKLAKEQKIKTVVFDRAGFLFHGKVKVFADAVRKSGLNF